MGLFDDVLVDNAPTAATETSPKRRGIFDDVLQGVRSFASATLNFPLAADRAVKGELVRLAQASQRIPSFQDVAPALGEIVRRPLNALNIPTEVSAGLALGTAINPILRGIERQAQDVSLAGLADIAALESGAGLAAGVGRGIRSSVRGALASRRLAAEPLESLIARARAGGQEAATILRTLRGTGSEKFRPVFEAVQAQRQAPRRPIALLTSQRGAVPLPDIRPGDLVRFGKQVRRVVSIDPQTQKAILAVGAGKTLTAPLRALSPMSPKQTIRETTGQAPQPPSITETQALKGLLTREQQIAPQVFRAGQKAGQIQESQLVLRRSLAGQGRAFQAGERRGAVAAEQPLAMKSLRRQGQAFAAGEQRGADTQKAQLLEAFRQQQTDVRTLQSGLIQRVRDRVPMAQRGKFLAMVNQAQTKRQVTKAFVRIERVANESSRRQLTAQLLMMSRRVAENPAVALEYRQAIRAITNNLRFNKNRPATLRRLEQTKAFLLTQAAQGKDVELPKHILDKLRILDQVEVGTLTPSDLERVIADVQELEQLGRTKQTARAAIYASEKTRKLQELVAGTRPIEQHPLVQRELGGTSLTNLQQITNLYRSLLNTAQRVDLAITPMDPIFDLLDGTQGYRGPNMRLFKRTLDADFSSYLDLKDAWQRPIQDLALELGLTEANLERIAIHAYRLQPNGVNYLTNSGLSQRQINALTLTPQELRWYQAARKVLEEPFPQVREHLRVNANREIQKVDNYWPVQTDWDALSDVQTAELLADRYEGFRRQKNVEEGFTLSRRGGRQPIRLNALETFLRHMDDVAYLLSTGRDIRMLTEIARSPGYGAVSGELGQKIVLDWLDTMARKGGVGAARKIAGLDTLRRNFGAARLGFKLSSILIQPTALFDGAARLGARVFPSFNEVVLSKPLRQFLSSNFPELRNRGADDPAYLELSHNPHLKKWQQRGFGPLQFADLYTASGVLWEAYKQAAQRLGRAVSLRNLEVIPAAIQEAQLMMRRTQASALFKDVPAAISRGALTGNQSLDRALLQFRSFLLNRWSLIRHDAVRAGITERRPAEAAKILTWITLATVAETGIRSGNRVLLALLTSGLAGALATADEETKEWTGRFVRELAGNVPFLGDAVSAIYYRSSIVPLLGAPQDILEGAGSALTGKKPSTRIRGAIRLAEGVAGITGIPGISQAGQIARGLIPDRKKSRARRSLLDAFSTAPTQPEPSGTRTGGLFDDVLSR